MQFEISRPLLEATLQNVSKGLSTKTPMPILMGIQITVESDKVTFIATNKEISVRIILNKDPQLLILEEGSCVVPGKFFVDIIKKMEGNKVEITTFDEKAVKIISNGSDVTLNAYDKSNFPVTVFDIDVKPIKLTCKELKQLVKQTSFACATVENRIVLTSINFLIKDELLTVIATDSFRLSKKILPIDSQNMTLKMNIPSKSIEEFVKIIDDSNEIVDLYVTNNLVLFKIKNISFLSRLVEGNFPDTSGLITHQPSLKMTFNKTALISAVDRASIFAGQDNLSLVKFNMNENSKKIEISSNSTELGRAVESIIPLDVTNYYDFQIAFASKYLLEALKAFDADEVTLNFNGEVKAAYISSEKEENLIQLLLPVRVF